MEIFEWIISMPQKMLQLLKSVNCKNNIPRLGWE